jgi:peptidylprolyl isomerase
MIPGFDKAVRGMKVGEKKTVTIKAKDAYGERNNNLVEQATRQEFPPGFEPKVGSQLQGTHADGKPRIYTIAEVTDTIITLDANPPLAGKDLTFEIELVEID